MSVMDSIAVEFKGNETGDFDRADNLNSFAKYSYDDMDLGSME
jgi:hypothetical protein